MHELRGRRLRSRCAGTLSIAAVTLTLLIGAGASADAAITCTHYASPDGDGDGLSPSFPFQIADFWSLAGPGKTLCLSDGTYSGANSMINPPPGLSGNSSAPITIQALNDGGVFIDGQFTRVPMHLNNMLGSNLKRYYGELSEGYIEEQEANPTGDPAITATTAPEPYNSHEAHWVRTKG